MNLMLSEKNKVCMDIGCSSGGFCDVLIKEKVQRIYAIDVGYGQFDWNLRKKKRLFYLKRQMPDILRSQ